MTSSLIACRREGSAVPRCWHLPPFWHQSHRHLLFSNPFYSTVSTCRKTSPLHLLRLCGHLCPAPPCQRRTVYPWYKPVTKNHQALVFSRAAGDADKARLLAAASLHSGDWLHAPPMASVGLRLSDMKPSGLRWPIDWGAKPVIFVLGGGGWGVQFKKV